MQEILQLQNSNQFSQVFPIKDEATMFPNADGFQQYN